MPLQYLKPIGPHYCWNFVKVLFLALQKLPSPIQNVPQDVSEHYSIFKSFLFFPLQICVGATVGYHPPSSYLCGLMARHCSYISHVFLFCVLIEKCSGAAV